MNMGFNRLYWSLRPAIVLCQTDTNVFCPKEEGKHLDWVRPLRLIPSIVRDKDGVSRDWTNGRNCPLLRNFYGMTSTDRHVKAWKVCHIGEDGWRQAMLGKINAAHANRTE